MKLEWFGRNREISAALVRFSNCMIRTAATEWDVGDNIYLTGPEWQILEVVIEHEEKNYIMADYANILALTRSSMSKMSKKLVEHGLIERYKTSTNQKSIILKSTEKGKKLYFDYVDSLVGPLWNTLFEGMASLDEEALSKIAGALQEFVEASLAKSSAEEKQVLIKI